MSLLALEGNPRLCVRCASIDLDKALDPRQFDVLPPLHSSGDTPLEEYIRKIMVFTMGSVESGRSFCELCSFLWLVASVAQRYEVSPLPSQVRLFSKSSQPTPPAGDGDAFTLATTSSHFIYPTSLSNNPGADGACCAEDAGAWLVVVKGSNTLERIADGYHDRDFAPSKIPKHLLAWLSISLKTQGTWIAEVSNDNVFNTCAPIRGRRLVGDVNFALVRSWLNLCIADHPSCTSSMAGDKQAIPHMKLIDCQTHTIVSAAPSMQYLALSYVWGQGPVEKYTYPHLPDPLPPTIKDAITVTLKLGYQYIWVDRYCIWQEDPAHKVSQILRMMDIYSRAVATIAAASGGPNPTYGLPGVSPSRGRQRHHQIAGRVGNRMLVSGATDRKQKEAIEKSVWDSRAWTFQEAALSRRFFTLPTCKCRFSAPGSRPMNISLALSRCSMRMGIHGGQNMEFTRPAALPRGVPILPPENDLQQRRAECLPGCLHNVVKAQRELPPLLGHPGDPAREPWRIGAERRAVECSGLAFVLWGRTIGEEAGWIPDVVLAGDRWSGVQLGGSPREKNTTDPGYDFNVTTKQGETVKWCEFVRVGGLLRPPSDWGIRLHIQGWVFGVGPFVGVSFSKPSRRTVYYARLPDSPNSTSKALKFLADVGTEFAAEFMFDRFEAISTYTYNFLGNDFAIVFQTEGTAKRRMGLLQLTESSVVEGDVSARDIYATADMQALGARWDSICLE